MWHTLLVNPSAAVALQSPFQSRISKNVFCFPRAKQLYSVLGATYNSDFASHYTIAHTHRKCHIKYGAHFIFCTISFGGCGIRVVRQLHYNAVSQTHTMPLVYCIITQEIIIKLFTKNIAFVQTNVCSSCACIKSNFLQRNDSANYHETDVDDEGEGGFRLETPWSNLVAQKLLYSILLRERWTCE